MDWPADLFASLALGVFCTAIMIAHAFAAAGQSYDRVKQQGSSVFLGSRMMNAGYWMLQPAVRGCIRADIHPSTLSWISLMPALLASLAVATGHWGVAAWCLLGSALLDVLDGAVARASKRASRAGAVLDSVIDRYADFFLLAGLLVFYRGHFPAQLLVLAALLGSFLIAYSTAKAEALHLTPPRGWMKRSDRLSVLIIGTALAPISQRWFEGQTTVSGWPVICAIGLIAILANISAITRFATLSAQAKET